MKLFTAFVALCAAQQGVTGFAGVGPAFKSSVRVSSSLKSTAVDMKSALATAANEARGLAMDSIAAAASGHMGLPLGAAEVGAVLYGDQMQYNPSDPQWLNRDRFILSAGHGSMFVYSWLNLAGFDLPMEEVKNFRQHHSMTPGHPEFPNSEHNTPGIEAACFAAHEKLDNLIVLLDSNDVTLDKMADYTQSEDVAARYEAIGWEVVTIDGHDLDAVQKSLSNAKGSHNGKPKLIICRTVIGKGIPEIEGTNAAHGEAGVKYVDGSKGGLGLPDEKWFVSDGTRDFFKDVQAKNKATYDEWQTTFSAWEKSNPDLAKALKMGVDKSTQPSADEMFAAIPCLEADTEATRVSGANIINNIAAMIPTYISGSADLHGSCRNYINDGGNWGAGGADKTYAGRNLYYGIREHAMGSIMNGFAYHGIFTPSGSTFLVFADYLRATIRVAALAELPVSYVFTHDSIGVGEDGPTHQPVETVSGLRVIPNLDVIRPADAEETVGAYVASVARQDGPTALIFSRQNLEQSSGVDYMVRRQGTLKGAYVLKKETAALDTIVMASGSEVQHVMKSFADSPSVRIVSMPCMERFDRQSDSYKEEVLPKACTNRIAMEAGVSAPWFKYVGLDGKVVGVDKFGMSAPGDIVMKEYGMTAENIKSVVGK
ncbi:hypothetical protein TrRE_jg9635 [Triparma retinervis]|uniref:transketolase n=1 Tax=Triparma retinervis TaxID=2557542 RepID=A0A9W7C8M4_9STRA|nr:hypothetical protein TrRE_jg9635 [Triparma retinervis]